MIAITRGVAVIAEIADDQVASGEAMLKLSFEVRMTEQAFTLTAADDGDRSPLGWIDELSRR
jgi:hypothetical protein